jgi:hypothetical protein
MSQCQQPVLTAAEVRYILEGIDCGKQLTRDEMEHALVAGFGFPVEEADTDADLVGYLQDLLRG